MKNKIIFFILALIFPVILQGDEVDHLKYLYKILSKENWEESQGKSHVKLPPEDTPFIHLSTLHQLDKIKEKFWSNVPEYVVLKLEAKHLKGKLVYEANPGGTTRYFHLYEGSIPMSAVVESTIHLKKSN